ncbi:MAG: CCA tRNA nucleotidyltransferase [Dehalococcoidia bacterium]|nr:MAG: CCA tRNA nucleotidyltransferase [Dehalococcoidia bacterium]
MGSPNHLCYNLAKDMPKRLNLSQEIEKQLPGELVNFMWMAGEIAHTRGEKLYLVGGVVRDLMLGQANLDLDLVVEGNAIELAQQLKKNIKGKITTHPRFNTAKLLWDNWSVDLTTARTETYEKPGALPQITPGSLDEDLGRRDFTINAMALGLNPGLYGKPIDPHGGRDDLKNKLIRVLHENSFIDDATRIWRGLRYEQRLDFHLEKKTLGFFKRDVDMLKTISADRTRYEIECILKEPYPEKVFIRAAELGVLPHLHPNLRGDDWLAEKFEQARKLSDPAPPEAGLYLALLAYPLAKEETERFISRLRLPKALAQILIDTAALKSKMRLMATPGLSPSGIFRLLEAYSSPAMVANSVATESPTASQNIHQYLTRLKYIEISLTGDDLIKMGVTTGPEIREIMERLQKARLDGEIASRDDEMALVQSWLTKQE